MSAPDHPSLGATLHFQVDEAFARALDERDPLQEYRRQFEMPVRNDGEPVIYFAGNSLGLQPKLARTYVEQELEDWATLAVDAHFEGKTPWYSYHELFRENGARLVGAKPGEVVMMNSLTVNLHLMMVTFYQPTSQRYKILIDQPTFPSDLYAVQTHLRTRGIDPDEGLLCIAPRQGEHTIRTEDVEALLAEEGDQIALTLMSGVNFFTGQVFDMKRITAAAKQRGCAVGWDLAHAAGNVPMLLHDWCVDFACWCSYKYLNSGPGAVAGCFVHEQHGGDKSLPRLAGWWGDDPKTRFLMQQHGEFAPNQGADGWQVSNPPILAMAPLRASLELFDEAGMGALRKKSTQLTGYLRYLIDQHSQPGISIMTPVEPESQGCQLSLRATDRPRERFRALIDAGVVGDFREPDVIRVAPTPLYNTFHEVWRFARILTALPIEAG